MTNARTARSTREKAAELRAQTARREARRRAIVLTASVIGLLGVLVAAVVVIQMAREDARVSAGNTPPKNLVDNSYLIGDPKAPVTLTVYEDFICPACKTFKTATAPKVQEWISEGSVKVAYRPIAMLDAQSTDDYSSRATNAVAAVLDLAPESFPAFHDAMFAAQPAEGGPGLPDSRLIEIAVQAGAPKAAVTKAVEERSFGGWVAAYTEQASKEGISQTPTILINGKPAEQMTDLASFTTLVEAAIAEAKQGDPDQDAPKKDDTKKDDKK
jgi:protein-disulfide isomerase